LFPTVLPSQPSKIVRGTLGLQSAEEVENLGQAFAFGAGEVLAPGAGIGGYLARKTPHMLKFAAETPSRFKAFFARQGAKAGETFVTDPTAFIATEALGGGGARTAEKIAGEDAGPGTKLGAMVVGGVIAQAVPSVAVTTLRRAGRSIWQTLLAPWERGGMQRSAKSIEQRLAIPREEALKRVEAAPEGVTGAQATEDLGALAVQKKALEMDPVTAKLIEDDLLEARLKVQEELEATFGPGGTEGSFQHAVVQSVAAPGKAIVRAQTDVMVRAAGKSYKAAYRVAEGHPIEVAEAGFGDTLADLVAKSAVKKDLGVLVTDAERTGMFDLLMELAVAAERQIMRGGRLAKGPTDKILSDEVLRLRRRIRKRLRQMDRAGATGDRAEAQAAIFRDAEKTLTGILEDQLPAAVSKELREIDATYRQFITVENAANRGNGEFTVAQLQTSIRVRNTQSQVARGEAGPLSAFAQQSVDLKKVLGKPRDAARAVRNMTPDQVEAVKGDFAQVMFGHRLVKTPRGDQVSVSGKGLLKFLEQQRETMTALGFTADDLARVDFIAKQLKMMELKSSEAVTHLLQDGPGRFLNFMAAMLGSVGATNFMRKLLGSQGAGPSLIVAKMGSETVRENIRNLTFDKATSIMRASVTDRELYKAILVASTDDLVTQIRAGRRIQAYLVSAGFEAIDEDE
ncbi:hypothetical protein LCGC14_1845850, partial [marine sediment metagenome]